jgi:hypothetical protein
LQLENLGTEIKTYLHDHKSLAKKLSDFMQKNPLGAVLANGSTAKKQEAIWNLRKGLDLVKGSFGFLIQCGTFKKSAEYDWCLDVLSLLYVEKSTVEEVRGLLVSYKGFGPVTQPCNPRYPNFFSS